MGVVFAAALGVTTWLVWQSPPASPSAAKVAATVKKAVDDAVKNVKAEVGAAPSRASVVFRRVAPSVVVVSVRDRNVTTSETSPSAAATDDAERAKNGLGTGVIVKDDGTILTAHHVVAGAGTIRVTFVDGTSSIAEVLATEQK